MAYIIGLTYNDYNIYVLEKVYKNILIRNWITNTRILEWIWVGWQENEDNVKWFKFGSVLYSWNCNSFKS